MAHDHEHDDHGQAPPSDIALRVKALESLLVDKGLVDPAALDAIVDHFEHKVGPRNGARVVARSWIDPRFRARLLADATAAIAEFGYTGSQGEHIRAVENTPTAHNLVVCTLCSCYPWPVLGLPPRLVQVERLSRPGGDRSARRTGRVRDLAAGRGGDSRVGFHR
jgi:nitrile hydratase